LDPICAGESRVGIDVELGLLDASTTRCDGALDQRSELPAGTAPLGPEVHDDREAVGAIDDRGLKGALGDVHVSMVARRHGSPGRLCSGEIH